MAETHQREAEDGGKPFPTVDSVLILCEQERFRAAYISKYRMMSPQFTVLLLIANNWKRTHRGISCYNLCKAVSSTNPRNNITTMQRKIVDLLRNGHIEIVGKGPKGCNVYCPSKRAMDELSTYRVVA